MEKLMLLNKWLNDLVWGPWMLVLMVGTGLWLSVRLRFPQFRYFGMMFGEVFGKLKVKASGSGMISSFSAMATALAATVGTGNVAGVATALHIGGPGALVWMLFSAILGMATKFSEISLAVRYRTQDKDGRYRGGTMYILEKALGMKWLAILFAVFTIFASFGIGSAVQSQSMAETLDMAFNIPHLYTAIVTAVLAGLVIMGGLKSIAAFTVYLVPFMAILYVLSGLCVVISHITAVPQAISMALRGAFGNPMSIPGALAGWSVKVAVTKGFSRGFFSNEAGLGSAPIVHSTAIVDHPCRQGLYGIFEVFTDTIVICTMTALMILTTGVLTGQPDLNGAKLTLSAFRIVFGSFGSVLLSVSIVLFAFSTIVGWLWYAETAIVYLSGGRRFLVGPFKVFWVFLVLLGGAAGSDLLNDLWNFSDTMNGLMAIPNLIGLLLLSGELRRLVKDFDKKLQSGELLR